MALCFEQDCSILRFYDIHAFIIAYFLSDIQKEKRRSEHAVSAGYL